MGVTQIFTKRKPPATPALAAVLDGFETKKATDVAAAKREYAGFVEILARNKRPDRAGLAAAMATLGKTEELLSADVEVMTQWNALLKAADGVAAQEAELEAKHKDAEARYKAANDGLPALRNEFHTSKGAWRQAIQTRVARANFLKDNRELLMHTVEGAKHAA